MALDTHLNIVNNVIHLYNKLYDDVMTGRTEFITGSYDSSASLNLFVYLNTLLTKYLMLFKILKNC